MLHQIDNAIVHAERGLTEAKHNDKREYFNSLLSAQRRARDYYVKRIEEVGFDNIEEFSQK